MLHDRYGNPVTTASPEARDAYVAGVDLFLAGQVGVADAFERAIAADPSFALAHGALARAHHVRGDLAAARAARAGLDDGAAGDSLTRRERSHLAVIDLLLAGDGAGAYGAILAHLAEHPRDVMMVQPCAGVFSLIGFSGQAGREAEQLAFMAALAPHYGGDWWHGTQLAFAQGEAGQLDRARDTIEHAFAANPRNAHAAHVRAHVQYERGEHAEGRRLVEDWHRDYGRDGLMHCHIAWHAALWALEAGDEARAWQIVDAHVWPGAAWGPPLNVLTDAAAFLLRAELAGGARRDDRWRQVSAFARTAFPRPGLSFADAHAALAHAMAGDIAALDALRGAPPGFAGDLVGALAEAFAAFAGGDWARAVDGLVPAMADHARLGGSRAQRDLLELTLAAALVRQDKGDEAARLLRLRRPQAARGRFVAGLPAGR